MPLVKAICTNCGGNLEVDRSKGAAICPFCGQAYIVEDAVKKFEITVRGESSSQNRLEAAEQFMKLGEYSKAIEIFQKVTEMTPSDYRGWRGLLRAQSHEYKKEIKDLSPTDLKQYRKDIERVSQHALSTVPAAEKADLQAEVDTYRKKLKEAVARYEEAAISRYEAKRKSMDDKIAAAENKLTSLQSEMQEKNAMLSSAADSVSRLEKRISWLYWKVPKKSAILTVPLALVLLMIPITILLLFISNWYKPAEKVVFYGFFLIAVVFVALLIYVPLIRTHYNSLIKRKKEAEKEKDTITASIEELYRDRSKLVENWKKILKESDALDLNFVSEARKNFTEERQSYKSIPRYKIVIQPKSGVFSSSEVNYVASKCSDQFDFLTLEEEDTWMDEIRESLRHPPAEIKTGVLAGEAKILQRALNNGDGNIRCDIYKENK